MLFVETFTTEVSRLKVEVPFVVLVLSGGKFRVCLKVNEDCLCSAFLLTGIKYLLYNLVSEPLYLFSTFQSTFPGSQ